MTPPPYPFTPTSPPCFQWPTFSSNERSSWPRRSLTIGLSAERFSSLTKLGHGPFSSSSRSGVGCFLTSVMSASLELGPERAEQVHGQEVPERHVHEDTDGEGPERLPRSEEHTSELQSR